MRRASVLIPLVLALSACGGEARPDKAAEPDPVDHAAAVEAAVSSVTKTVKVTEGNDPNNDIGRPGLYQQATVFYDSRAKCDDPAVVHISCGAKLEVFESAADAKRRMKHIRDLTDAAQGLVTEYDYLDGATLLRVTGELKPSAAKEYEAAFTR